MPKKKKTLKQKLQTDKRRQLTTVSADHTEESVTSPTFSLPQDYIKTTSAKRTTIKHTPTQVTNIQTHEYKYLRRDLIKTSMLTTSIVVLEIILRYVFERG